MSSLVVVLSLQAVCRSVMCMCVCVYVSAGWNTEQAWGFNVGTVGFKVFSGAAVEEFGYTVQQFTSDQGKW